MVRELRDRRVRPAIHQDVRLAIGWRGAGSPDPTTRVGTDNLPWAAQ